MAKYAETYTPTNLADGDIVYDEHIAQIEEGIQKAYELLNQIGNDLEDTKGTIPTCDNNYANEDKEKVDSITQPEQSDWSETDTDALSYIKNKPISLSEFQNDVGYLKSGEITPETTTFAKPGKNLWDGVWQKGVISGPANGKYTYQASTNGRCAIFKAEPWKHYVISRANNGNRFGVACCKEFPTHNMVLDRLVCGQTSTAWTNKRVVMGGDENYIVIYCSNDGTEEANFQIEKGDVYTGYSPVGAVVINIEEEFKGYDKTVAWFGDSISELRELPHLVSALNNYDVRDCSFAGSGYSTLLNDNYTKLSFRELSKAIVSGDFTEQQAAADAIKAAGGSSDKQPNLDTLKAINWAEIDEAVVFLGTNDYGSQVDIGDGTIANEDELKASIKIGIENILSVNPAIQFYFILPMWRGDTPKTKPLTDYIQAIREVGEEYHYPIWNAYKNNGINSVNASYYMRDDMLHPTSEGDLLLADKIAAFLKSN